MTPDQVKKLPPFDRLLYWIRERESIRRKRALGLPPPWTDDPILRTYRFCNVRRMDDRVSQWLYWNWYRPHKDHPNTLLAAFLARHFNHPDTLEAIGYPTTWDPKRVLSVLQERKAGGLKVFHVAYIVSAGSGQGGCKIRSLIRNVITPILGSPPNVDVRSIQATHAALIPCYGLGSFMAGQIVADLRWALTGTWKDRHDWAPLGPGSLRGLKRLYAGSVDANLGGQATEFLDQSRNEMRASLPNDLTKRLEAMDYQNCLCEWDKYERTLWGQGKPKHLYPGGR